MHDANRTLPPGAKASFHLGLWSIITAVVLLLPVAIGLGIAAIVTNRNARRRAEAAPQDYSIPPASGMTMGIVGLCLSPIMFMFIGMVSAIAIPALLSQRNRARDKASIVHLHEGLAGLAREYDLATEGASPETLEAFAAGVLPRLSESLSQVGGPAGKNPWNPAMPACMPQLHLVSGLDPEGVRKVAAARADSLGTCTYVIQFRQSDNSPTCAAGAVLLKNPVEGSLVFSKVVSLD